jgi:hypothetical protein
VCRRSSLPLEFTDRRERGRGRGRGRGWGWGKSKSGQWQESLVLYKLFNTLWIICTLKPVFFCSSKGNNPLIDACKQISVEFISKDPLTIFFIRVAYFPWLKHIFKYKNLVTGNISSDLYLYMAIFVFIV